MRCNSMFPFLIILFLWIQEMIKTRVYIRRVKEYLANAGVPPQEDQTPSHGNNVPLQDQASVITPPIKDRDKVRFYISFPSYEYPSQIIRYSTSIREGSRKSGGSNLCSTKCLQHGNIMMDITRMNPLIFFQSQVNEDP